MALRLALATQPSPEARKRIDGILRKLTSEREERIKRLFADLDGEKADRAQQQLQAMGEAAAPTLERLLSEAERSRLQRLTTGARVVGPGASWWAGEVLRHPRD